MHLETLPLTALKPAPYNPRKPLKPGMPAYRRLERSLAEFELVQPLVWNRTTGHVVGGHQRLEILKHRGVKSVECVVVELPLEREKALNVALNNQQVGSDWDVDKLTDLVADLQALPDFDATLTGFDEDDLRDLLLGPQPLPSEEDDEPDVVRVTLEILPEAWERIRPAVDALLAAHRDIQAHVRLPA
jgi:ParB-like chromosome segregation protein Spo0J